MRKLLPWAALFCVGCETGPGSTPTNRTSSKAPLASFSVVADPANRQLVVFDGSSQGLSAEARNRNFVASSSNLQVNEGGACGAGQLEYSFNLKLTNTGVAPFAAGVAANVSVLAHGNTGLGPVLFPAGVTSYAAPYDVLTPKTFGYVPFDTIAHGSSGTQRFVFCVRGSFRFTLQIWARTTSCDPSPCMNSGVCSDTETGYACACPSGFEGANCETNHDDCASSPCQNGGTCSDGVATYSCSCPPGFGGVNCEVNVDDCRPNPCQNGGTCSDLALGYTCSCAPGYEGTNCETNHDDCAPNPCQNGGSCNDLVSGYTCSCAPGYEGTNCETDHDDCSPDPCQNGGTCSDGIAGYTCTCPAGYEGTNCETDHNFCSPNPCQNGGTCTDGLTSYTCACPTGTWEADCSAFCGGSLADCNHSAADTCEVDLNTDSANCGDCGVACGTNEQCISGTCVLRRPCSEVARDLCISYFGASAHFERPGGEPRAICYGAGSCTGCNCGTCADPWRAISWTTGYDNWDCQDHVQGTVYCPHNPCNCNPGTEAVFETWDMQNCIPD